MTEEQTVVLRMRVEFAIVAAEEALSVAERAVGPAPLFALRAAVLELKGARLACEMRLEGQGALGE